MMPHGQGALNDGGSPGSYDGGAAEVGTDRVMLKKGPWTAAEDAILSEYVRTHGEGNWNAVQRNTGLARCGKSCRLRWANHLRPNLKKGAFTPEEERIIVELHAKLGNKWARMAAQLPGRTDNEIKNYWNTRVKRRQRQGLPLYPPGIEPSYQSQQQPSYQLQQQPQATTTPLSSYNPMTTQSSSSSFTFQTQLLGQSPSPAATPTTPTPPSPLSSIPSPLSPSLSSPHQFPTLPLFEAPNSMTNTTTTANNRSSLSFLRPPPLLQTPPRFKRFHQDTTVNHHDNTNVNNDGQGAAMQFTSTNTSTSGGFVIPMSNSFTSLLTRPNSCPTTPTPSSHTNAAARFPLMASSSVPSFSVNTLPFNSGSPNILRGNFDSSGQQHMVSAPSPIYSMRSELPSSQLLSQNSHPEMTFVTDDNHERNNLGMRRCSSGLLDDMLAEAQAFAGGCSGGNISESFKRYHEEKHALGGYDHWGPSSNANLCSEYRPKEEGATPMNAMHEDLTKLLHVIPSTRLPEWFSDSGDFSNGQSSVVTDDNIGLEMQQIASLFPVDPGTDQGRNPGSCSWDNLPGIC